MRREKLEELRNIVEELKTIKITQRKVREEDKFLKSESYFYTLNNGITIPREKLIKGENDGSASIIMPITKNKEI